MEVATIEPPTEPRPWRTIWFSPRLTMRQLLVSENTPGWILVVALAALHSTLSAIQTDVDGSFSLSASFMPMILGAAYAVFSVLVGPFILAIVGGWLGGDADATDIRQSSAWCCAPFGVAGLFWIPLLAANGGPIDGEAASIPIALLVLLTAVVVILGTVWTIVLQVITLAEVQRFSILRTIACLAIPVMPLVLLRALG